MSGVSTQPLPEENFQIGRGLQLVPGLAPSCLLSTLPLALADVVGLQPDARGVATSLGLNERLFVVDPQEVHELVGTGRLPEPGSCGRQGGPGGRATDEREGGVRLCLLLCHGGEEKEGLSICAESEEKRGYPNPRTLGAEAGVPA